MTEPRSSPAVDAVIPTYGDPSHLAEAIESVLGQTADSWQLTIIHNDPGDGPGTAAIESYVNDPRVSCVRTGEVIPQAANWSKAIQAGDAPYVAMLHDDDVWDPTYVERRVEFLEAHPDCGFVFSAWREIDESGETLEPVTHRLPEGLYQPREFVPRLFETMLVGSPTAMTRRRVFEEVGPTFDGRFLNMDWEMWMRIAVRHPVGYLAVRDCGRRLHSGSVTSSSRLRGWGAEELRLVERFEGLVERELPQLELPRRPRVRRRAAAHLQCALDAIETGEPRAARGHLRGSVGAYPLMAFDPRFGAGIVAMALGERGRRGIERVRTHRGERGVRLHLRDYAILLRDRWSRHRRG